MEDSHFDIFLTAGAYGNGAGNRPFGPFGYLYDVLGYGNGVNGAYWQGGMHLDTDDFLAGRGWIHPGRLTWNLQITHLERKIILQTSVIMFHVNLPGCTILGGGFQYFFIFTSTGGNDPIWPAYFSNGLAQPPASIGKEKTWDPPFNGRFGESSTQQVPIKRGDVSSQEGIWSIIYYHQSTRWWF